MPSYGGKINCIYIDPPYNTGNEGWCYNDNLNDQRMRKWLGETVAADDMEKNDKWCCMMYPRICVLHELLAEDGTIFISIDDNEQHRLRMIMDEIFGRNNFVANIVVKSNPAGRNYGGIARTHEYVLVYTKDIHKELRQGEADPEKLPYEDCKGRYKVSPLTNGSIQFHKDNRPNLFFPIYVNPENADENGFHEISLKRKSNWIKALPRKSQGVQTVWRWGKGKINSDLDDVKGKIGRDGNFRVLKKTRDRSRRIRSILTDNDFRNMAGTRILKEIFEGASVFNYPKSPKLIEELIDLVTEPDGIVLDSFAGSGTTAHAVMELNKMDGGNRYFILVESQDYANDVTAERVRRLIKGVPTSKDHSIQEGYDETFSYWELGPAVDMDTLIKGVDLPDRDELSKILFHIATGDFWTKPPKPLNEYHIGSTNIYDIFLYYKPEGDYLRETAITLDEIHRLPESDNKKWRIIYAPTCYVTNEDLLKHRAKYLNLPYDVFERLSPTKP